MSLLNGLTEQEKSYYLLLNSMRKQVPNDKEFSFVRTIVQFSSSPVLLSMVIACPKWYHTVEIKEALSQNDVVPAGFNQYLRQVLMVLDMFRDMRDRSGDDRSAVLEEAKGEIHRLKEPDREFLKNLISGNLAHQPCDDTDAVFEKRVEQIHHDIFLVEESHSFDALTSEEKVVKAKTSSDSAELKSLLLEKDPSVWETALKNRYLAESDLIDTIPLIEDVEVLKATYGFPRWFFKDAVREALLENNHLPDDIAGAIRTSWDIVTLFEKLSRLKRNMTERNATAIEIAEKLKQVPELELQYITVLVKRQWPSLISIIKAFYHYTKKTTATGKPAVEALEEIETLSNASIDQLIQLAAGSSDEKELTVLLQHPDLNVFRNLLSNPNMTEQLIGGFVHTLTCDQLLILARSKWNESHSIRNRMVHNPNLPPDTAQEIVKELSRMKDLLDVLRDSKIKSVEVKNLAFNRLNTFFTELSVKEKAETIIETNGEIFRELWGEIFRDEELLTTLVRDYDPTPETLVRIIHSRLTPMSVIHMIINRGIHLDNAGVVLEFFNNPKVSHDVLLKLQSQLDDASIQLLKKRGLYREP